MNETPIQDSDEAAPEAADVDVTEAAPTPEERFEEAVVDAVIEEAVADAVIEDALEDTLSQAVADAVAIEAVSDAVIQEAFEEKVVEAVESGLDGDELADAVAQAAADADVQEAIADGAIAQALEETVEEAIEEAAEPVVVEAVEAPVEEVVVVEDAPAPAAPAHEVEIVAGHDPFRGPGDWYVVHTYAGYENKVKTNLESRIHTMQMEDKIFDVHIPMEDVMEIKGGKKQVVQRKIFPGYLLVKMIYDNDSWYVVRNTPGVTGFVAAGTGSKPTPLSKREVEKILIVKKEEVKPQFRLGFEEGDVVRIIAGPFADFNGTISEINLDQSKLKVLVNIFDRETPVELSFDQVAKV
uniref:Transcription termination/antitermination protein NusG n=1 Tax=uncultured actinobacterium Rifle_16ft_4_minimus_38826 TaxID=1665148 RepID=A0A0H4TBL7_9ACTN|nr:transcription antitermination protein NusG [uncultured actinobacterium Rifle_16ft_4_minimus_38826]